MAENRTSVSPQKSLQSSGGGGDPIPTPNPQNPSLSSPQIPPSPSMGDLSQISSPQITHHQGQIGPSTTLDYPQKQTLQTQQQQQQQLQNQQQQQQQNLMANSAGFQMQQQQSLQRSGSMARISQIQQQFGAAVAANAMRQHAGIYGGQMSFGGGAQIQPQQQQMGAAGMARSGMIGQGGQLPMLPGQNAANFNLQSQMLAQQRQKAGLVQGTQLNPANSSGQALPGMQTVGMMGSLGLNPQLRGNGPLSYGQQRLTPQLRQQQQQHMLQQTSLTSPQKLSGQNLPRTPSLGAMNPQLSALTQNGQATLVQVTLASQQWLAQMQPSMPSPVSPSCHPQHQQRQQQAFMQQQLSSSQLHQKSMVLTAADFPAGTAAAPAPAGCLAAASDSATTDATTDTTVAAVATATTSAAISKDADSCNSVVFKFDRIATWYTCIRHNHCWRKF